MKLSLGGANYTYVFQNITNAAIFEKNCSALHLENTFDPYRYPYICFTIDLEYGFLTMFFVFAPGLMLSALLGFGFWNTTANNSYLLMAILLSPVMMISFPLVLLISKVSKYFEKK